MVRLFDEAGSFLPYGAAPQLRSQLDLSYAQLGVLLTAMPAGGVVGLGLAALADVVSRRRLAAISTAATSRKTIASRGRCTAAVIPTAPSARPPAGKRAW